MMGHPLDTGGKDITCSNCRKFLLKFSTFECKPKIWKCHFALLGPGLLLMLIGVTFLTGNFYTETFKTSRMID